MEDTRNAYKIWSENLKGRDHPEVIGVDVRLISEWNLGNTVRRCRLIAPDSVWGAVAASCEHGNEPLDSIKGGKFLD
jgi:hypothetical protein